MALVLADRVRETTTVTGTGTATLLGAVSGYQSFAAVGNANTTYYVIANQSASEWEVGIGTYTSSGTTLSRDTVLSSSNSGSLVDFSAGTKDVFVDYPAGRAVYEDAAGNVDGYPITGGTIDNTVIGGTTPAAGTFTTLTATGQTSLGGAAGAEGLRVITTASAARYLIAQGATSSGSPALSASAGALVMSSGSGSPLALYTNAFAQEQARIAHTASAVNYVQVTGAATGSWPTISSQGSDASIPIALQSKASGPILFQNGSAQRQFRIDGNGVGFNYFGLTSSATAFAPVFGIASQSGDTNVSAVFQSKGTGAIDLAAGSSGVNISNGGTVTAITRTANGTGYTSIPSVAITAPTTAGGVQATATATMFAITATVQAGGTGYAVGNVLTVVGGTYSSQATFTVSAVSAGVVTAVTLTSGGTAYSVLPTNPVSTTGGTGTGATLNITSWGVSTIPVDTAGSGYVEQPTVTFSGGGGSGAAAYATVGSGVSLRSLGGGFGFFTPTIGTTQGEAFRIYDFGGSTWVGVRGHTSATAPAIFSAGAANVGLDVVSNGTSPVSIRTGGTVTNNGIFNQFTQLLAAHTASAVNYVQVTGAATGGRPTISSQGSDTNIDLALTPKGTGNVRFGTYTGTISAITGYIEIKDSGGTVRRLAVVA